MKSLQKSAPFAPVLRRIAWNSANYVFNLAVPAALFLCFFMPPAHKWWGQTNTRWQTQTQPIHCHLPFIMFTFWLFFIVVTRCYTNNQHTHAREQAHLHVHIVYWREQLLSGTVLCFTVLGINIFVHDIKVCIPCTFITTSLVYSVKEWVLFGTVSSLFVSYCLLNS